MKTIQVFLLMSALFLVSIANGQEAIKWMSFQEMQEAMKVEKKKVFIDLYTDWCGWCKKMDASTFREPTVAQYMNKYFYAVKFDAEGKDTIVFNNFTFTNTAPAGKRGTHYLAYSLLDGRMSYPSFALLDENMNRIHIIAGYQQAEGFLGTLMFFGTNQHQQYTNYVMRQLQQQQQQQQQQQAGQSQ